MLPVAGAALLQWVCTEACCQQCFQVPFLTVSCSTCDLEFVAASGCGLSCKPVNSDPCLFAGSSLQCFLGATGLGTNACIKTAAYGTRVCCVKFDRTFAFGRSRTPGLYQHAICSLSWDTAGTPSACCTRVSSCASIYGQQIHSAVVVTSACPLLSWCIC